MDNFCPRIEGVHLEGCCPPLEKRPSMQCTYHVVASQGQAFWGNSTSTQCVGGANTTVPCCRLMHRGCYKDPQTLNFVSRLIGRNKQCCFETCPPASYWRAEPNPRPQITAQHQLTGASTLALCQNIELQECSVGAGACPADDPCPPPPDPGPSPQPSPSPGPSPGPSPAPSPQPSPAPSPGPAPGPSAPEPQQPTPEPEPPSPPPVVAPPGS
ncbi:MAG: hypothetical protein HUU57_05990 [Bdellovibrio sp.]|nr:hypothetical protein [Bdellovibrio sp.]